MRYVKPDFYDSFCCVAGKCPDTCCAGWQIVIDEQSLENYDKEQGSFGTRLHNSIDWEEGVFYQCDKRCAFLNEKNLCDLYTALGSEALCDTCRDYPRHTEEFDGLRELSLSLSCPIAAEMILKATADSVFTEYETDEEEPLAEEFEDFDLLLFTQLEDARKVVFSILKDKQIPFEKRMHLLLALAYEMDACIAEGQFDRMDEVVRRFEALSRNLAEALNYAEKTEIPGHNMTSRYQRMSKNFEAFEDMELLREEWKEKRDSVYATLYEKGEEAYSQICTHFEEQVLNKEVDGVSVQQIAENLMVSFVYTWFCGAVYDEWIYSKMAAAAFCTEFILEFTMAQWMQNNEQICFHDFVENAYRLTREIEHSDLNLNALEDFFKTNQDD